MSKIEKRIAELGLELPEAPSPMANYVTARAAVISCTFPVRVRFRTKNRRCSARWAVI